MSRADRIRILIVAEPGLFRQGLSALLARHRGIEVVGEADGAEKVARLARQLKPGVILVDADLPDPDAVSVTRLLARGATPPLIVVLSAYEEDPRVAAAMSEGAVGCVTRRMDSQQLVAALKAAVAGDLPIPSAPADDL
jgi:DNA-binding NarL/FixJ family response regulator